MILLDRIFNNTRHFFPHVMQLEIEEWETTKADRASTKSIEESIRLIESRWSTQSLDDPYSPIFIFSAGWRSGSTLLQRLVMTDERVMIWGEPFTRFNIVQNLASSLSAVSENYPPSNWFFNFQKLKHIGRNKLPEYFIANLYPEFQFLREAHRSFFLNLFAKPAIAYGYPRWGIKEVRLDIEIAFYLKWLFPRAKFLFLYRNPYKAYASIKPRLLKWSLYEKWPQTPIRTPYKFGKHWQNLATSYLRSSNSVDGLVIQYEELLNSKSTIDRLEEYLGLEVARDLLNKKVGATENKPALTRMETFLMEKAVNPLAKQLGYNPKPRSQIA